MNYYNGTFDDAIKSFGATITIENMDIKNYSLEICELQYRLFMKLGIISQHKLVSDLLNAPYDMLTIEI